MLETLNRRLDAFVRPRMHLGRWSASAFLVCGFSGLGLSVLLGVLLAIRRDLSGWVLGAVVLDAMATFLVLAMATKIVAGRELLIYYHHEVAILATATLLLWLLNQPLLAYLDVVILGVGLFLACGRMGCLMVGCCHGLPHRWGVCYRKEHAEAGFTPYFVGVRLFPVQLVESVWVFGCVAVGAAFVLGGRAPGEALAWYVVSYDVGRFGFEFLRGDPDRPYPLGFSEGQWTSLLLMVVVVGAELYGAIPFHLWHLVATAGVAAAMIGVGISRRYRESARHRLLHPHHIQELAALLECLAPTAAGEAEPADARRRRLVEVGCTRAGIQLSTGRLEQEGSGIDHYTLSALDGRLRETDARELAHLILQLKHHRGQPDLIAGRQGVFHLLTGDLEHGTGLARPQ